MSENKVAKKPISVKKYFPFNAYLLMLQIDIPPLEVSLKIYDILLNCSAAV